MARQTIGCLFGHGVKNVRLGCLTLGVLLGFCLGTALKAADSSSNSLSSHVAVPLEYQETGFSVGYFSVSLTTQPLPFKKEPPLAQGKTVRGFLKLDGNDTNGIAFIWQRETGKLFLDLNRNQDLTDDLAGIFTCNTPRSNFANFSEVRLPINTPSIKQKVLVNLNLYDYGSGPSCNMTPNFFWGGKVTLQGHDYQVGVFPNSLRQPDFFTGSKLLLRPWAERSQSFNTTDGELATVPFSSKCFFNGHGYELKGIFWPGNTLKYEVQFAEQSPTLSELKITGKFISRLVMAGASPAYLVILDHPTNVVKVPVGSYSQPEVLLDVSGARAFSSSSGSDATRFIVHEKTPLVLDAGGPLTNSIAASRHGRDLRLDYRLVGAGGRTYQLAGGRTQPEFVIYKDNKKLASGKFEFG